MWTGVKVSGESDTLSHLGGRAEYCILSKVAFIYFNCLFHVLLQNSVLPWCYIRELN